ncbi:hypothetical protein [Streptomyces sp. NPDC087538]|uniref:hypothetical protein n=1 Tax=Streptomyces sp. NPDC087538 TaxID=3365797 RepID=UPI0037F2FD17
MINVTAGSLTRNDRVVVSSDELPYLVDAVVDIPNGGVRVTYSSGDTVEYAAKDEVPIVGEPEAMTGTPRLDSLTVGGTNHAFDGIRLADGNVLTLKARPGAETAEEVFLYPGLDAPDTEAWENEDQWEAWLTGGEFSDGSLYLAVPVDAVRELIVQHGGEHADQENSAAPEATGTAAEEVTAEEVTAKEIATRALAEWGITAHFDEDAGNSWLVIGRDQSTVDGPGSEEPQAVLYLFDACYDDEVMVDREPEIWDQWRVMATDDTGIERHLITLPLDRLAECVEAIAEWMTKPSDQIAPANLDGELLAEMADLHGRFKDGYTPEDIRTVFYRIYDTVGIYLVCVWEYVDEYGFGGNSEFFAEDRNGVLFEAQPDIHQWLSGQQETPGTPDTWVCAPVAEPTEFQASDDSHNYARADRTDD